MRFPFSKYIFTRDPLEFHFRLLVINGFWPIQTKNKLIQALYSIYSFLCIFSPTSMFFTQVLDIYLLRNDLKHLTKNLCASSVSFAAVFKQALISNEFTNIEKIYKELVAFRESRTDPEDLEILEKADRKIWQATKQIYSLAVPCITTWMIYPALDSSNEKTVPFAYRLPVEYDWSPLFEIIYSYQSISLIGFMIMIISNDMLYYGMVILINAQYEILIKNLKALDEIVDRDTNDDDNRSNENDGEIAREFYDPKVTEEAGFVVKDCYVFHQNVLREIEQLTVIYAKPYLVHFIAATLLVGSIIIDVIVVIPDPKQCPSNSSENPSLLLGHKVSKGIKFQLLQRIIYSLTGVFDTFLCCFFTTEMQDMNFQLRRAVYSTPWYKLKPELRKDLLMISMKTLRAPAVKVANIFPLNLSIFLEFLKTSYNITALLYQTMNR